MTKKNYMQHFHLEFYHLTHAKQPKHPNHYLSL